ncbi:MAG: glycoside hydrolase family 127 protein [Clostridia bacterium]|nr:glycoside hydrolase family 127 protein [Clostridia bacterium]
MEKLTPVSFKNVNIKDGFWKRRMDINEKVTIFSVRDRFRDTGRFEAFKFNWKEDSDVPKPHIFWDSDVAKWMESAAYIIAKNPNSELQAELEELISLMKKNQCEDGYFNIFHTVVQSENRFMIRDNHELYCLGHFIEAAVAYYMATGKENLINIVDKYIDLVIRIFCVDKSAAFMTPGHEEIELALIRLYRLKKDKKYLDLAMFFINERGVREEQLTSWSNSSYNQSHIPVRQQKEAMGHCVRACYLYSAMADAARETDDSELLEACKNLFEDIVNKKMYISGGIGSSHHGEAFTVAYDLPNDTAYAETCASIALMMFADRMKDIVLDSRYADIVEREIYNGIISGISLDGKAFFYENPLEIDLCDRYRHTSVINANERLPITQRQEVFSCSCCPPNMTRFIATIGEHIFSTDENSLYVHQFIPCNADFNGIKVEVSTEYPSKGNVRISVSGAKGKSVYIRIPGWCKKFEASENYEICGGYAKFFVDEDAIELEINIPIIPRFYASSSFVRADAGKLALMCGPVLYCAEQIDNDVKISDIRLDTKVKPEIEFNSFFGCNILKMKAYKTKDSQSLYIPLDEFSEEETSVTLIPYFGFANRGESDMAVWLKK